MSRPVGRGLRVLMQGRTELYRIMGGDTVMIDRTAVALRKLGVEVDISTDVAPALDPYDLVHITSSTDDPSVYRQARHAAGKGIPIAVTPLYWDNTEVLGIRTQYGRFSLLYRLLGGRLTTKLRGALWRQLPTYRRLKYLFRSASMLLPNSWVEDGMVRRDFKISARVPSRVVMNAIDPDDFAKLPSPEAFVQQYGRRGFALCVGRVEVRKNQVALLRASIWQGFPVVLIGRANPREPGYVELCRKLIEQAGALWIPQVPEDVLYSAYAAAAVHVLPSWWETTGLVSLEAGAAGCPLVCSNRQPIEEYFGDMVETCDPGDIAALGRAVARQMAKPRDERLRQHILRHFTWENMGRETLAAYQQLMENR